MFKGHASLVQQVFYVKMYNQVVCLVVLVSGGIGAVQLPPEITKCRKTDTECLSKSVIDALHLFKNGYKEFGFPPLEPFHVEKIEIAPDPATSVKLNQKYEDIYMHGITDSTLKKISVIDDGKTCRWEMEFYSPNVRMDAQYSLTGQLLVFPLNGHGKCNITLKGITNKHEVECEHYMKKGKSHIRFTSYKMNMSVENCYFDFPNIIPGNEQISKEVGKAVNENSLEIFEGTKGGFEKLLSKVHLDGANSVFSKIPEDDLFLS